MQRDVGSGSSIGSGGREETDFRNVQARKSIVFVGGFDLYGKIKNSVKRKNPAVHRFWCHSQLWANGLGLHCRKKTWEPDQVPFESSQHS